MNQVHESAHKYQREIFNSGYIVYRCILPDCSHYLNYKLALGHRTICHGCGVEFIIGKTITARKGKYQPKCPTCVKKHPLAKKEEVTSFVSSLVGKIK